MAIFCTVRYSAQRGGNTGTARYVVRRDRQYRTVTRGPALYASVFYPSDLASVRRTRPYSVQVSTVHGEAATPVLHGTRLDGDAGIVL